MKKLLTLILFMGVVLSTRAYYYESYEPREALEMLINEAYSRGFSVMDGKDVYSRGSDMECFKAAQDLSAIIAANEMTEQRQRNLELFQIYADYNLATESTSMGEILEMAPGFAGDEIDLLKNIKGLAGELISNKDDASAEDIAQLHEWFIQLLTSYAATRIPEIASRASSTGAIRLVKPYYLCKIFKIYYQIDDEPVQEYVADFAVHKTCDVSCFAAYGDIVTETVTQHFNLPYVEVDVEEPGLLLRKLLTVVDDLKDIFRLKVTGKINEEDVKSFSMSFPNLGSVDLSEVDMEVFNDGMFSGSTIEYVKPPKNLKEIRAAFSNCPNLQSIIIPEGVEVLGYHAFYRSGLKSIYLPESLKSIGAECFCGCRDLVHVGFSEGLQQIDFGAFWSCESLKKLTLPNSVLEIGPSSFYGSGLETIKLSENLKFIPSSAFCECSHLQSIEVPGSVEYIDESAFMYCRELTEITINEGLRKVGTMAFFDCGSLTDIRFPSTVQTLEDCLPNSIRRLVCASFCPPVGCPGGEKAQIEVFAPYMSVNEYRANPEWSGYGSIRPINNFVVNLMDVFRETILFDKQEWASNDMTINLLNLDQDHVGNLSLLGDGQGYLQRITMTINDEGCANETSENDTKFFTSLVNERQLHSYSCAVNHKIKGYKWSFLMLPFDLDLAHISKDQDVQWVMRWYNGANRASGQGDTWENVPSNAYIPAYRGFILMHNGKNDQTYDYSINKWVGSNTEITTFSFMSEYDVYPDTWGTHGLLARNPCTVHLDEYSGEDVFEHNRSWNLVGNPYPSFFDLRFTDFTAPVTLWRGNHYMAVSPIDDQVILRPFEAMFVQRPADQDAIVFDPQGRQRYTVIRDMPQTAPQRAAARHDRSVFNLTLSSDAGSDHTRFVINESARIDYEMSVDATKFFADEAPVQIYTLDAGVEFAINERPLADASVRVGMRLANSGDYTLSLKSVSGVDAVLIDNVSGEQIDLSADENYVFHSEAGTFDDRFEIVLRGSTSGVSTAITSASPSGYYTISGVRLSEAPTAPGVYIHLTDGRPRKVVIK